MVGLAAYNLGFNRSIWKKIGDGLKSIGVPVKYANPECPIARDGDFNNCKSVYIWNGLKPRLKRTADHVESLNHICWRLERGFFDRMNYTQIDYKGFNHMASWADNVDNMCGSSNRLEKTFGKTSDAKARKSGYILILGQVANDSQLYGEDIRHCRDLTNLVLKSTDYPVSVRPHPTVNWKPDNRHLNRCATLKEAVKGARFVITINSNSGNEALGWGCPVMCLGRPLYKNHALNSSVHTIREDIQTMLDGYEPVNDVRHYLEVLANNQFNDTELVERICDHEYWSHS